MIIDALCRVAQHLEEQLAIHRCPRLPERAFGAAASHQPGQTRNSQCARRVFGQLIASPIDQGKEQFGQDLQHSRESRT